jgi:hypothetical protein
VQNLREHFKYLQLTRIQISDRKECLQDDLTVFDTGVILKMPSRNIFDEI